MSFTNLYLQTSGNDMNAGSSTADTADVTQTNGSWDITADTFIAASGTPFSAVTTNDWVSIYADGTTSGAVYVAQVTAVGGSGANVTLSTTAKYGTKPAAGATGKSAKVNGAWASLAVVTSLFASVAVPAATKVNIKAGTYANTTTARAFGSAGLTTGPLWWCGYKTTPADMDTVETVARVDGTDIPLITFSTGALTITGNHQMFSNISVTAARSGTACSVTGLNVLLFRCRSENTTANSASSAYATSGNGSKAVQCWFKATTTSTRCVNVSIVTQLVGCVMIGGLAGVELNGSVPLVVASCAFRSQAGSGIVLTSSPTALLILGCTFKAPAAAGVLFTLVPTSFGLIAGCLFDTCGTYGINNNSGANTNFVTRLANDFYGSVTANETGFGDVPSILQQTESGSPVVGSTDLTLVASINALANGLPGLFENETYTSFLDIGAVQQASSSGGGLRMAGHGGLAA